MFGRQWLAASSFGGPLRVARAASSLRVPPQPASAMKRAIPTVVPPTWDRGSSHEAERRVVLAPLHASSRLSSRGQSRSSPPFHSSSLSRGTTSLGSGVVSHHRSVTVSFGGQYVDLHIPHDCTAASLINDAVAYFSLEPSSSAFLQDSQGRRMTKDSTTRLADIVASYGGTSGSPHLHFKLVAEGGGSDGHSEGRRRGRLVTERRGSHAATATAAAARSSSTELPRSSPSSSSSSSSLSTTTTTTSHLSPTKAASTEREGVTDFGDHDYDYEVVSEEEEEEEEEDDHNNRERDLETSSARKPLREPLLTAPRYPSPVHVAALPSPWSRSDERSLRSRIKSMVTYSKRIKELIQKKEVSAKFLNHLIQPFVLHLKRDPNKRELIGLSKEEFEDTIYHDFFRFVDETMGVTPGLLKTAEHVADLTLPHEWFPKARSMTRKVIYHSGPTNSGKTHAALEALRLSGSGVYCGPLRLLALEVFDRLNSSGVRCSLVTGQQKIVSAAAHHVACTVEMFDVNREYDVVVLDEIQLIGHDERGWAWSRAVLGAATPELHVCGDGSALPILQQLLASTGDELVVKSYERLSPLKVSSNSLDGDFSNVKKGDCVIVFSRRNIFQLKRLVEEATSLRCCVIYGSLPPEVRSRQAALFNDPESGYDVLIATDAVGMGLNLNIRRIVFSTLEKFDGSSRRLLTPSELRQVAGRAGRFNSQYPKGYVTTLERESLAYVKHAMKGKPAPLHAAGLFPTQDQFVKFCETLKNDSFASAMDYFTEVARLDGGYFMCNVDEFQIIANVIEHVSLTPETRYVFCLAPCNAREKYNLTMLRKYAEGFSRGRVVLGIGNIPKQAPTSVTGLHELEASHQVLDMYMWLSYRLPGFVDALEALALRTMVAGLIEESLQLPHLFPPRGYGGRSSSSSSPPPSFASASSHKRGKRR